MTHPHRIRNLVLFAIVSLTLSVSAVLLFLCYQQARALIFTRAVPLAAYAQTPADSGISSYRDVTFTTPDGLALQGWFIPPPSGGATILFVHGHGGGRNQFINQTRLLSDEGYGMLLFDLRNSGTSDGTVTSMGYYETDDVLTAFAWLKAQPEVDAIVLYGGSMGGATAIRAMARLPEARALIVDTAYTSLRDVVGDGVTLRTDFPASPFAEIIVLMAGNMADADLFAVRPIDDIARVAPRPLLIMHGTHDEVIPFAHAQRLYDAAGEPKTLYVIENGIHGDSYQRDPERYWETVLPFLQTALR